jgi:hypothetical protein
MKKLSIRLIAYFIFFWVATSSYARWEHPDTFKVTVNPDFFWTFQDVDLTVSAVKNNLTMPWFEGYLIITVYDERWYILKPSEASLPNDWLVEVLTIDQWKKTFKGWVMIKKWWKFKICAADFDNESRSWCNVIEVYDKTTNNWVIKLLNRRWITLHKTREEFKPNNSIRRDEAAKMIVTAIQYAKSWSKLIWNNKNCKFDDIDEAWSDLQRSVRKSCKLWIFNWSNNLFRPKDTITNGQLLTVIWRILYWKLDESWASYVAPYANKLKAEWLLTNVKISKSDWDYPAKRWTVAKLIAEIIK